MKTITAPATAAPMPARERLALCALCLAMLMASLDTSIVHTALPTLALAFGATFRQAQWIILAYLLVLTASSVAAGRLGDALGRRPVLLFGLGLFIFASVLCALAPTLPVLLAARALQGAGGAVMVALSVAFVADVVPGASRGRAMGLIGTMSAAGTTLGPVVGGQLLALGSWPAIFLVNVPVGLLTLLLVWRYLPAATARAAQVRGFPLIRLPDVRGRLGMTVLVSAVLMATMVTGPFYLSRALGLNLAAAGLALAAGPMIAALSGIPAGMLADRFGAATMAMWGLAGVGVGCVALAALPAGLASYLLAIAVITASYAQFQAANNTALMAAIPPPQRGAAAGLLGLARNTGLIAGTSAMGALFAAGWSGTPTADMVAHGMRTTFFACSALMLLALALGRFSGPGRP